MFLPRIAAPTLVAILLALLAPPAQADELDTLTLNASQAVRYDSNLFRRAGGATRSETLSTSTLGMELDKRYGLQRLEADAAVATHRYRANDYLNYNSLNYRGVWHWALTPRLRGTLARTRAEDINNFDYYESFDRNIRTDHTTRGDAALEVGRDWRLLGGLARERRTNERPTAQEGDYTVRSASLGVLRLFPSGSQISYRLVDGQGTYQNRIAGVAVLPNSFDQTLHEVRVSWQATGKTTLSGRLGHLARKHPGFEVRDFSGLTGDMSLRWAATGKVGLTTTWARTLGANQTNTNSYATTTRLSLTPYWTLSARTTLYLYYEHSRYAFGGALPGFAEEDRRDQTNTAILGARWKPFDSLDFAASLGRSRRTSNEGGSGYSNNSVNLQARLSF